MKKACRSCGAEIIFLPTKAGKTNPVNWESLKPEERSIPEAGGTIMFAPKTHQISHFATCPYANKYRSKK